MKNTNPDDVIADYNAGMRVLDIMKKHRIAWAKLNNLTKDLDRKQPYKPKVEKNRVENIVKMRKASMTYREIAEVFGTSRQAIHALLKRNNKIDKEKLDARR